MARTSAELVLGICDLTEDLDLDPFIESATQLLDDAIAEVDAVYTPEKEELIERWLAAHFACMYEPRTILEEVRGGGAGVLERYEGRTALGLNHTRYGQMAMQLDTAGGLAILNTRATTERKILRPSITHLAIDEEE